MNEPSSAGPYRSAKESTQDSASAACTPGRGTAGLDEVDERAGLLGINLGAALGGTTRGEVRGEAGEDRIKGLLEQEIGSHHADFTSS